MIRVRDVGFSPSAQVILSIRNSTFDTNFNQVTQTDKALVLIDNLVLTGAMSPPNWTPSLSESHKMMANRTLNQTVDILMTPLSVNATAYLTNITSTMTAHHLIEMVRSQITQSQASLLASNTFGDKSMDSFLSGFEISEDVIWSQVV